MLVLTGEVLEIERKPYEKTDADGVVTKGVLTIAHIRDGKRFSRPCVVPDDLTPAPTEGEELAVEVRVFPSRQVRGLDWSIVRRVDAAEAAVAPSRVA